MSQIISTPEYKLQEELIMVYRVQEYVVMDGVTPKTLSHIYKVGIQPILTYGCSAVNINHKSVKCMDRVQGMLIKTALGLPKNRRNSPLLAALGIEKIERLIKRQQLSLLRNSLISNSKGQNILHWNDENTP